MLISMPNITEFEIYRLLKKLLKYNTFCVQIIDSISLGSLDNGLKIKMCFHLLKSIGT